ncbi:MULTISPECIES: hypothetical protein [Providencia]|jgi:hypothetical protein|uniref:Uncharacterized protein n=2 Tax=Providencia alcalifaciens TaxID=126385 RepID=A0A291EBP2_9GAMM|nr:MULTISPECIES: hypothetical protein [Providencia]ATG16719.1 hypothetical protein CO695_10575 [Providencia alcalifaciens]EEB46845.1 hypothetical protein PROVALCAL_01163 [Providencia alcalifaciens DSM 30120]ETT00992.1 hypothetical protein HMPREF1568_2308 [Providencia alcalifaciens PAL-3]EUC99971.1 hypothetical protein HMPREF1566_1597 [Providencia alcalifaciens PAL-1]EUD04537.1 hypothetical protein HMPREF1565_0839 [Providencia alcalifaciens RIMD 1656011]
MAGKKVQLHRVKLYGKNFYFHENSISGFWEDDEDKEDIRSAIMLTSGSDLVYPVPLSELLEQLKEIIDFQLP